MMTRVEPKVQSFETDRDYTPKDLEGFGNDEFRRQAALKYIKEGFPKFKRLQFSEFIPSKIDPYVGEFVDGDAGILEKTENVIGDPRFEEILGMEFGGVNPKFSLMTSAFFNTGFSVEALKGKNDVRVRYNLSKNPNTVENSVVVVRTGAEATVVREVVGKGKMRVSTTKYLFEEGARARIFNVLIAPGTELSVDSNLYVLKKDASVELYDIVLGSGKTAVDHDFRLTGEGSSAIVNTVHFETGGERADLRYALKHLAPKTYGRINGNGVLTDEAYAVFRGIIDIRREAYEADSEEKSYTLNLSSKSRADSIPSLFVDNNTVKAKHASSVGNIDEDKLYYMMSRGLDKKMALRLAIESMFRPVIDKIELKTLKEDVEDALSSRI